MTREILIENAEKYGDIDFWGSIGKYINTDVDYPGDIVLEKVPEVLDFLKRHQIPYVSMNSPDES